MLTREENEVTRVGRGTPAGEMLRRYWMPVAAPANLRRQANQPVASWVKTWLCTATKRLAGVVAPMPHRNASRAFGRVDEKGFAPYHGKVDYRKMFGAARGTGSRIQR
jgi:5,5'-dehydrodivanillate O-demethylase